MQKEIETKNIEVHRIAHEKTVYEQKFKAVVEEVDEMK